MATDDDDRKRLLDAARGLAARLRRMALPSLPITSKFRLESSWNGGWYLDVGFWSEMLAPTTARRADTSALDQYACPITRSYRLHGGG
jgi:hypothetical protein